MRQFWDRSMIRQKDVSEGASDKKAEALPARVRERIAYSVQEAAELLGIGRTHLYALISSGSLESIKLGSRRLITRDAIDRLLAASKMSR